MVRHRYSSVLTNSFFYALGTLLCVFFFQLPFVFARCDILLLLPAVLWRRCPKCRRPGHTQETIALDPRLFKRVISEKGVSFNKKGHKRLEYSNYVCQGSTPAFFLAEVQRVRAMYAEKDAALNQTASERAGLVSNIVGAVAPVTTTVATLRSLGSSASGLAMPNLVAIGEQARLADTGLSACASALGGAISAATGRSSGITDDLAPAAALAKLRGAEAAAQRVGAKRLSQSALSLSSPSGSHRMYVDFPFLFLLVVEGGTGLMELPRGQDTDCCDRAAIYFFPLALIVSTVVLSTWSVLSAWRSA